MEIKNKLTVTRREEDNSRKKKGHQGTYIRDPWAKTMGGGRIECGRNSR